MGLSTAEPRTLAELIQPSGPDRAPQTRSWLAAYTRARHESSVVRQFEQTGLDTFLPTYRRLSRWSDRIRKLDTPLFPGYVFVRVAERERTRILKTAGVVSIVCCGGRPAPLAESDIAKLRLCAANPAAVEPHPYLRVGQRVRVKHGPFRGWEGVLLEKKNSTRLVITVDQIMKSVSIDLHGADVESLG